VVVSNVATKVSALIVHTFHWRSRLLETVQYQLGHF
jgi:hypothetical protein